MSAVHAAELLVCIGAIGVVQFGCLALAVRQLHAQHVTTIRLGRRMNSVAVRHAPALTVLAAVVLLAGLALWMTP